MSWKRIAVYAAGLVILCFGVVLNTKTGLGVACMNTVPYSLSEINGITLGTATFFFYCFLIILEFLLNRKASLRTVLQLPFSFGFSLLVDFFDRKVLTFEAGSTGEAYGLLLAAIVLVALGTTMVVSMRIVPAAPDGFVQALADRRKWTFGKAKTLMDGIFVCTTCIYSLATVHKIVGVGIGTLIALLLTGNLCRAWNRMLGNVLETVQNNPGKQ